MKIQYGPIPFHVRFIKDTIAESRAVTQSPTSIDAALTTAQGKPIKCDKETLYRNYSLTTTDGQVLTTGTTCRAPTKTPLVRHRLLL